MGAATILARLSAANALTLAHLSVRLNHLQVSGTLIDAVKDATGALGRNGARGL
jgi:hypothetical protein